MMSRLRGQLILPCPLNGKTRTPDGTLPFSRLRSWVDWGFRTRDLAVLWRRVDVCCAEGWPGPQAYKWRRRPYHSPTIGPLQLIFRAILPFYLDMLIVAIDRLILPDNSLLKPSILVAITTPCGNKFYRLLYICE